MSDKPYIIMETSNFPTEPMVASMGDQLMLHDNLESTIPWENREVTGSIGKRIKLLNTMTLFFCLGGEVYLTQGSERIVMHSGDVIFSRSGLFGKVESMSHDLRYVLLILNEKFFFPLLNTLDMAALHRRLTTSPICTPPAAIRAECLALYKLLKERLNRRSQEELQEPIVKGYLQTLIFIVYSQYLLDLRQEEKPQQNRQQDLFNRFVQLLQQDFMRERNVNYYANQLCVTPRYLSRIIHEVSGHFASEHIDLFVLAEAKQLIRSKLYTILEISERLNFSSASLFSRYFKKRTGYTPKEYQELE